MNPLLKSNMSFDLGPAFVLMPQLAALAISIGGLVWLWRHYPNVRGRAAFLFACVFLFFYQLPSILYGGHIYAGLPVYWSFLLTVCFFPIGLVIWLYASLVVERKRMPYQAIDNTCYNRWGMVFGVLAVSTLITVGGFFYVVPWRCSSLWALFHDPDSILLARELTMKLNGTPMVNRLYGAYVNVVGPLICFLGVYFSVRHFQSGRFAKFALTVLLTAGSIALLLMGGVKGALFSAGIFVAMAIISLPSSLKFRAGASICCLVLFGCLMVLFSTIRYMPRSNEGLNPYDFVACVREFGTIDEALQLVDTAGSREEGGVGVSAEKLQSLADALRGQGHSRSGGATSFEQGKADSIPSRRGGDYLDSLASYASSLWTRLFRIPLQVATWNYLYVMDHHSFGMGVIPVVNRYLGGENLAQNVYQAYGTIYSSGDATSTSTAPTSFVFAYPAHLGGWGLALAFLLLVFLDIVSALLLQRSQVPFGAATVGFFAALCLSLASSDFFTVLFSHGGVFGICLLVVIKYLSAWGKPN